MSIGPLILDISGQSLSQEDRELLKHPLVGGLIYFTRNFESKAQITELTREVREIRPELLLAVDQEGGRVQRFKQEFTRIPAMQAFLEPFKDKPDSTLPLIRDTGWLMASEVLSVGIDFSFAPVLDLDDNQSEIIGDRSFSANPEEMVAMAGAFLEGMREAGMPTTGKHFPGHGSVREDSHLELPCDSRAWEDIESYDLVPFKELMPLLNAVMPAHILFPEVDSEVVGFSGHWLQNILRQQMGFQGVVFSDDLSMEGAVSLGSYGDRAIAALVAGCDIVLACNNRDGAIEVIEALEQYTNSFEINDRRQMMAAQLNSKTISSQLQPSRYLKTRQSLSELCDIFYDK